VTDSPPGHPEIERIVAPNPGPMTLEGTNTYVVAGDGGAFVIDPGPADEAHIAAVRAAADARGGLEGILLTHSHLDHSGGVPLLGDVALLWGSVGTGDETSNESGAGSPGRGCPAEPPPRVGPFEVIPTPGHSVDHVCLALGGALFCGDLILGRGSSFVPPDGGSLIAYLESLRTVRERQPEPDVLCPGHGPYVTDARAKVSEYIDHRLERERKLLAALAAGERSRERLLAIAWDDVPAELRPAAAVVMEAHLEKLEAEGRLPDDLSPDTRR
jgi:glyoxylase-like metal-dependent hydrolase (beta-lactamase superfamily II)